jgi:hypothetical protein
MRVFQDDLPTISAQKLRANGTIGPETEAVEVKVGDAPPVSVGLYLQRFPNKGTWTLFVAPCCGRRSKVLRLLEDQLLCRLCLVSRGVRWRCDPVSVNKRAAMRIPKLRTMLESTTSLRVKPMLWGTMERRKRLEATLARCEHIVARATFKRRVKDDATQT